MNDQMNLSKNRTIFLIINLLLFLVSFPQTLLGLEDNSPPQILSYSISPSQVNTDTLDQTLNITVRLKDDLTGVKTFEDLDSGFNSFVRLQPLIGTQTLDFFNLQRVSGNNLDGVYTATATLPKYSKVGIWASTIFVNDKIGNNHWFGSGEISALFPVQGDVFAINTAESNSVVIDRNWELKSSAATAIFPAGTVVTKQNGGSFAFYQMINQDFSIDQSTTTIGLDGAPIIALKLGIPGINLSFSKNVSIAFNINPIYNGRNLQIQSLAEEGSAWANETIVPITNGTATFSVNHATKFAGILDVQSVTSKPSLSISKLSLSAIPKIIRAGKSTIIKGLLKNVNGEPVVNKKVVIKIRSLKSIKKKIKGKTKIIKKWIWLKMAIKKTDKKGVFLLRVKPRDTTMFKAVYSGDSAFKATNSNVVKVVVKKLKK